MKKNRLKSVISFTLIISILLSSSISLGEEGGYFSGQSVSITLPSDKIPPNMKTEAERIIEEANQELENSAMSDTDVNQNQQQAYFTDTQIPIEVVSQGDIISTLSSEYLQEWSQNLHLSRSNLEALFEHYKNNVLPSDTSSTVKDAWKTLIATLKDYYSDWSSFATDGEIEKLAKPPELPETNIDNLKLSDHMLKQEIQGDANTFGNGEMNVNLGDVNSLMGNTIIGLALDAYKDMNALNEGTLSAGTQIYANEASFDGKSNSMQLTERSMIGDTEFDQSALMWNSVFDQFLSTSATEALKKVDDKEKYRNKDGSINYSKLYQDIGLNGTINLTEQTQQLITSQREKLKQLHPDWSDERINNDRTIIGIEESAEKFKTNILDGKVEGYFIVPTTDGNPNDVSIGFTDPQSVDRLINPFREKAEETKTQMANRLKEAQDFATSTVTQEYDTNKVSIRMSGSQLEGQTQDASYNTRTIVHSVQQVYQDVGQMDCLSSHLHDKTPAGIVNALNEALYEGMYDLAGERSSSGNVVLNLNDLPDNLLSSCEDQIKSKLTELAGPDGTIDTNNPAIREKIQQIYNNATSSITGVDISTAQMITYESGSQDATEDAKKLQSVIDGLSANGVQIRNATTYNSDSSEMTFDISDPKQKEFYTRFTSELGASSEGAERYVSFDEARELANRLLKELGCDNTEWGQNITNSIDFQRSLQPESDGFHMMHQLSYSDGVVVSDDSAFASQIDADTILMLIEEESPREYGFVEVDLETPTDLDNGYQAWEQIGGTTKTSEELWQGIDSYADEGDIISWEDAIKYHPEIFKANTTIYPDESNAWYEDDNTSIYNPLAFAERAIMGNVNNAYNNITGSMEQIHGLKYADQVLVWLAATNGYIVVKDKNGKPVNIRKAEVAEKQIKKAWEAAGYPPEALGKLNMYTQDGKQGITIQTDKAAMISSLSNPFMDIDKLKELLGGTRKTLEELMNREGVGNITLDLTDLTDMLKLFDPSIKATEEWWKQQIADYWKKMTGREITPGELDSMWAIIQNALREMDASKAIQEEIIDPHNEETGNKDDDELTLDDIIKMIEDLIGEKAPDDEEGRKQFVTEHIMDFLNSYNGQKTFKVTRIMRKEASKRTMTKIRQESFNGQVKWRFKQPTGEYFGGTGTTTSMILEEGTNIAEAYGNVSELYQETFAYDYSEVWILEPLGIPIYTRTVEGNILQDGNNISGQNVYQSRLVTGPSQEKVFDTFAFTATKKEPEQGDNTVGLGIMQWIIDNAGFGQWYNGYTVTNGMNGFGVYVINNVPETITYRVE